MKQIKVFEDDNKTIYELFVQLFEEGYKPMPFEDLLIYQNEENKAYNTNIAKIKGRNIIIKKIKDLDIVKQNNGRLLWLGPVGNYHLYSIGNSMLNNNYGRLVGVKEE